MYERDQLERLLQRLFKSGPLRRLPRKRQEADALMALALSGLDPEGIFEESEINLHLIQWLAGIALENSDADYVTVRRAMVDARFLRRATDGVIYRLVPERISESITVAAQDLDPGTILEAMSAAREERQRVHGT